MFETDIGSAFLVLPYGLDADAGKPAAGILPFPTMADSGPDIAERVLERAGVDNRDRHAARLAAVANESDLGSELVAASVVDEDDLADAIAAELRLPRGTPGGGLSVAPIGGTRASARIGRTIEPVSRVLVAPRIEDLGFVSNFLSARPHLARQLRVATPTALAEAQARASMAERSEAARLSLSRDRPALSARHTMTGWQGFAAALVLLGLAALLFAPFETPVLRLLVLPIYLACIALRFGAILRIGNGRRVAPPAELESPAPAPPRYSVLVALREERRDTIEGLVAALRRLRWPRSRLDILMICEADDHATVAEVARAIHGLPCFRLAEVPPSQPRTKPKALNFALPLARGEFVVLFDAEDRPDPDQLHAAWRAFRAGGEALACVQAPLVVTNGERNWLAAHFALEYAALFGGLLPFLAQKGMPLPLGGTSNHFRRAALRAVGGWDSHNVAEDADLGVRLARHGYRTGVIDAPTFEEAPERWIDWRNQRTRWMKGWMQTYLVHMRDPRLLLRQLGLRDFAAFQLLFAGMLLSSILNSLLLGILLATGLSVLSGGWPSDAIGGLLVLDLLILLLGYGVHAGLTVAACRTDRRHRSLLRHLWTLPSYWLLISLATLRALWHLAFKPQLWEKTPHGREARIERDERTAAPAALPTGRKMPVTAGTT